MGVVESKDLYKKDIFDNFNKSASDAINLMRQMSDESLKMVENLAQLAKKTNANTRGVTELVEIERKQKKQLTEKQKVDNQILKLEEKRRTVTQEQTKRLAELRVQQQQVNREAKQAVILASKETGARKKLDIAIKKLSDEYRNILALKGKETNQSRKLLTQILKLKSARDKADESLGNSQFKVRRYENALKSLRGTLGNLGLAFGFFAIKNFVFDLNALAQATQGVEFAFKRLGDEGENAFNRIKELTRGLVSDLDIKKALVNFDNFNISLEQTDVLMEFLAVRATQTGESIEQLQSSLVEGLSKESKLRIDNLGISAAELNKELAKTPNFVEAVANIARREVAEAGAVLDEAANGQQKWNVELENFKQNLAGEVKPAFDEAFEGGAAILKFFGENLSTIIKLTISATKVFLTYKVAVKLLGDQFKNLSLGDFIRQSRILIVRTIPNMIRGFRTATFSVKSLGTAIKSIPFVAIISAIPLIFDLAKGLFESSEAATALTEATEEYNKEIIKEKATLESLFFQLKNANEETGEREKLIDRINSKYGTTLKNLDDENEFVKQLNDSYAILNKQLEQKIKQQIFEQKLVQVIEAELSVRKAIEQAVTGQTITNEDFRTIKEFAGIDALKDIAIEIKNQKEELFSELNELQAAGLEGSSLGGGFASALTKSNEEALKKINKQKKNQLKSDKDKIDERNAYEIKKLEITLNRVKELQQQQREERERADREAVVEGATSVIQAKKFEAKSLKDILQESQNFIEDYHNRRMRMMDEEIQRRQDSVEASRQEVQDLKSIARERNLDASESIAFEREQQKKELARIEEIQRKKQQQAALLAGLEFLSKGGSVSDFKASYKELKTLIASFYSGTKTTLGAALGRTNTRDGHLIFADDNEAIINPSDTAKMGIGKTRTTHEAADILYKYDHGLLQSLEKPMFEGVFLTPESNKKELKTLNNKMDTLINSVRNIDASGGDVLFDTVSGVLVHQKISKGNRRTRRFKA